MKTIVTKVNFNPKKKPEMLYATIYSSSGDVLRHMTIGYGKHTDALEFGHRCIATIAATFDNVGKIDLRCGSDKTLVASIEFIDDYMDENRWRYDYLLHKASGKKVYAPMRGDCKVDIASGLTICPDDERYDRISWPTVNDLTGLGVVEIVDELRIGFISDANTAEEAVAAAKERFGIDISPEAFQHNIDAWHADLKSGIVDGDFFIFSSCGCNPLRFDIFKYEGAPWQKTYAV